MCLKILSIWIVRMSFGNPWYIQTEKTWTPAVILGHIKIRARYLLHKTAPSWRGHLWITHLAFHPSCAVQPHKVHWRTQEENLQALLHLLITNVALMRSEPAVQRQPSLLTQRTAIACDLIIGQCACCSTVQLRARCSSWTIYLFGAFAKTAKTDS
jgi:hypothetical protein